MLPGVSKTAVLTLRARAEEHAREDRIFADPLAAQWFGDLEWPSELDAWYGPDSQLSLACRADDIDRVIRRYVEQELPELGGIVELGCGLSSRHRRLEDLTPTHWLDVDLPEVIARRKSWGVGSDRHALVPSSVMDFAWMDEVRGEPSAQIFIAEGLLYYLPRTDVDALIRELRRRFVGSALILDVVGVVDHVKLLENTSSVGSPVLWKLETDFARVLEDFGLELVPEFDPDRLMRDGLQRYWHRLDMKTRGSIYLALSSPLFRAGRSGNIIGRLTQVSES